MKLSKIEKKFIAFMMIIAMIVCFLPSSREMEAAEVQSADQAANAGDEDTNDNSRVDTEFKDGQSWVSGDFVYMVDTNENAVIVNYTGTASKVEIPSKIANRKVVSIWHAFENNTTIREVVLPDSVTKIEYEAFAYATGLEKINLDHIRFMGLGSNFHNCTSLKDVVLPEGAIFYDDQFDGAKMKSLTVPKTANDGAYRLYLGYLTTEKLLFAEGTTRVLMDFAGIDAPEIVIPDSVTDISGSEFDGVRTKKVVLGSGIRTIPSGLFTFSDDLDIQLGKNTQVIGKDAFYCSGIKSLVIPDSVTEIQYEALLYTYDLSDITFSKNLKKVVGGVEGFLYGSRWYDNQKNGPVYTGGAFYSYKGTIPWNTTVDVKAGTKGIAYMAFQSPDGFGSRISGVTLPEGLLYIGGVSFFNTSIEEIQIPETVTEVGAGAFGNTNLKSVYIPKSVKTIGDYAFGFKNEELRDCGSVWIQDDLVMSSDNMWGWIGAEFFGKGEIKDGDRVYQKPHEAIKVDGFKIIGYSGTAAETYAKKNGFTFVDASTMNWPGHSYGNPEWTWSGVKSAKAKFTCNNFSSHTKTLQAKITSKITKKATVNAAGQKKFTATVTLNGKKYTSSKTQKYYLFNTSKTGLQKYENKLYYVKNGVMKSATGFAKYNSTWYYVSKGKAVAKTGVIKGKVNGTSGYWRVEKGKVNLKFTGFAKYNTGWYYLVKGRINTAKTGIFKGKVNSKSGSWFVKKGKVQLTFSGTKIINGKRYKIQKGKVVKVTKVK